MGNLKLTGTSARKPPLGNVPMHALVGVSRVLEDSGVKYTPGNFMEQSVRDAVEVYDSAELRHRLQCTPLSGIVTPETFAALDGDSGLPHIDHMISGLLILRTLMIRDGVLPEDPGMGKRKTASLSVPIAITSVEYGASFHMGEQPPTPDARPSTPEERLDVKLAGKPIDASMNLPPDEADVLRARARACDPDAERKAATDANVERLKRDAAEAAEVKRKWEQRCLSCNGDGKRPSAESDQVYTCNNCHGTGQRSGAEGMRL